MAGKTDARLFLLLAVPLLVSFYSFSAAHSGYAFPFHTDEWQHLAQSIQLVKDAGFAANHPYFPGQKMGNPPELGYHFLQAQLLLSTGLPPAEFALFFSQLVAVLGIVGAFVLGRRLTGSFSAGFFAALFYSFLRSDITFLGVLFAVPVAAGVAVLPFSLLFLHFYFSEGRKVGIFLFAASVAAMVFIHVPFAVAALFAAVPYSMFRLVIGKLDFKGFLKATALFAVLAAVALAAFSHLWLGGSVEASASALASRLSFPGHSEDAEGFVKNFDLAGFLGLPVLFLAAAGGVYSLRKKPLLTVAAWCVPLFAIWYYFSLERVAYFLPYRRASYYFAAGLALLAGIGAYALANGFVWLLKNFFLLIRKTIRVSSAEAGRLCSFSGFLAFACLAVFVAGQQLPLFSQDPAQYYHDIETGQASLVEWAAQNVPPGTVLSYSHVSVAVTPLSFNKFGVCTVVPAQLGGGEDRDFVDAAITWDCPSIHGLAEKCGASYVLIQKPLSCEKQFELLKQEGADYFYQVKRAS